MRSGLGAKPLFAGCAALLLCACGGGGNNSGGSPSGANVRTTVASTSTI